MIAIYFDLERKYFGFRYSELLWKMVSDVALSIPKMIDHLLSTVRNA